MNAADANRRLDEYARCAAPGFDEVILESQPQRHLLALARAGAVASTLPGCVDDANLAAFASGDQRSDHQVEIARHVVTCSGCAARVEPQLDDGESRRRDDLAELAAASVPRSFRRAGRRARSYWNRLLTAHLLLTGTETITAVALASSVHGSAPISLLGTAVPILLAYLALVTLRVFGWRNRVLTNALHSGHFSTPSPAHFDLIAVEVSRRRLIRELSIVGVLGYAVWGVTAIISGAGGELLALAVAAGVGANLGAWARLRAVDLAWFTKPPMHAAAPPARWMGHGLAHVGLTTLAAFGSPDLVRVSLVVICLAGVAAIVVLWPGVEERQLV